MMDGDHSGMRHSKKSAEGRQKDSGRGPDYLVYLDPLQKYKFLVQ